MTVPMALDTSSLGLCGRDIDGMCTSGAPFAEEDMLGTYVVGAGEADQITEL